MTARSQSDPTGDHADWLRAAVERYEAPLIRHADGVVHDLDRARDIVQDTFLRLCRQERSAVEGHLAKWLFTVCRNRAVDVWRKESRMNPTESSTLDRVDTGQAGPVARLQTNEATSEVWSTLGTLPPRQQQALLLKFQDGFSYREIADAMGTNVNNVGVLLHTALKSLRKRVGEPSRLAPEA